MPDNPNIYVDVHSRVVDRDVDRAAADLKARYERIGAGSGESFAKGIESASPKVQQAFEKMGRAADKVTASESKLNEIRQKGDAQTAALAKREQRVANLRDEAAASTLRVAEAENKVNASRNAGLGNQAQHERNERNLINARKDHDVLIGRLASEERALDSDRSKHISTIQRITVTEQQVTRVRRDHINATNDLRKSYRDLGNEGKRFDQNFNPGSFLSRNLNAFSAFGSISPSLLAPVGLVLDEVANAAVSASQSIWLLPAAAAAAAAGMGTFEIATSGLGKAIKDMGDPKQFAKDLAGMAPAAQQVALELQHLAPVFHQIRDATSGVFFAGIPEMLNNLATQYGPAIQNLTTGIAGAFNTAMTGVGNLLMTPEMQQSIQSITTNIVSAFQQLAPAIVPMVDAFAKITEVGAQFLPGLATATGELATKFNNFIQNAARTGDLSKWIQEGIDAVKAISIAIFDAGKMIYDVFGLHSKQSVEDFKNTMDGIIKGVGAVLDSLQVFFVQLGDIFRNISDSPVGAIVGELVGHLGGVEKVLGTLATAWLIWEVGGRVSAGISGLITLVDRLSISLAGTGTAAATGAAGMSAAGTTAGAGWAAGFIKGLGPVAGIIGVAGIIDAIMPQSGKDWVVQNLTGGLFPGPTAPAAPSPDISPGQPGSLFPPSWQTPPLVGGGASAPPGPPFHLLSDLGTPGAPATPGGGPAVPPYAGPYPVPPVPDTGRRQTTGQHPLRAVQHRGHTVRQVSR